MVVTDKGQVTIPKGVRVAAGVVPGSQVRIVLDAGKIVIQKVAGSKTTDRRAQLRAAAGKVHKSMDLKFRQMSADDIMNFLRPVNS
jgi:antitoxin PrlF